MGELLDDPQKALDSVAWYLGRRDHSELELRRKLKRRYTEGAIDRALSEAQNRGWLRAKEELAQLWTEQLGRRRRSHRYIRQFLQHRGLDGTPRDQEAEIAKCQSLLETKFHKTANFSPEEKTKAYRFLSYRGFDNDIIRRVIYEKS